MKRDKDSTSDLIVSVAVEVFPALVSYGVESVEVSFHTGDENVIHGVQYRDTNGVRVPRTCIPLYLNESVERNVVTLLSQIAVGSDGGVLELCLPRRTIVCRQKRDGVDAYSSTEWVF